MNLSGISIAELPKIGAIFSQRLKKLGIRTISDLLFYFPFRYDDLRNITTIRHLRLNEVQNFRAKIELIANKRTARKRMTITEALIADETGQIKVVWFQQPYLAKALIIGQYYLFSGKIVHDRFGLLLSNPTFEPLKKETIHTGRIVPVYPLCAGISQKQFRMILNAALPYRTRLRDWLPHEIKARRHLLDLQGAIKEIHFPTDESNLHYAKKRLQFDEMFFLQLKTQSLVQLRRKTKALPIPFHQHRIQQFIASLPFQLTNDQKKGAWAIVKDLEKEKPMNRLLEGDVGSGKTVVAAIGLVQCFINGFQGVLLAPTEILAQQHFRSFQKLFHRPRWSIGLLTRSSCDIFPDAVSFQNQSLKKKRKILLEKILRNEINLVVGTHALLEDKIRFGKCGLAIIDEQHRFGVRQRKALTEKSGTDFHQPHLLSLTATPIPRSLTLTAYGDLDCSILKEKPPDRKPILTSLVSESERQTAYRFIDSRIEKGEQAFVVCPLISESDVLGVKSVNEVASRLEKTEFSHRNIAMIHGKLKNKEKENVMKKFLDREIDLLVATSVIEVGIDVANATIMMIEDGERFGLSQLHQFRGRVGRGERQAYCFVFSNSFFSDSKRRLSAFVSCDDGFALAEKDLEMRGPGEMYGTMQSGLPELKIADLRDHELLMATKKESQQLFEDDPDLSRYPMIKRHIDLWLSSIHLE